MSRGDGITVAAVMMYLFILLINLAWIGTLIWAVIYVATHLGGWING